MKKIEVRLPTNTEDKEFEEMLKNINKNRDEAMRRAHTNMAIAQNKMLCEMMIHHGDYDCRNYDLKFSNEYHADTGCIDMSFYFEYHPKDNQPLEAFQLRRAEHIMKTLQFYGDYNLDHYNIEDRVDENGKPYDCRIYYGIKEQA